MIPIFLLNLSFFLLNCFIFTTRLHAAINRAPPNTVDIYDLSTFAYSLTIDPAGCHSIYWSMLNQGTSSETLHMALVMNVSGKLICKAKHHPILQYVFIDLRTPPRNSKKVLGQSSLQPNAWVAVGFGSSMQNSDMIIAISSSNTNNTSPRLGEWLPTGAYESPVKNPNAPLIHPIVVSQSGPIMVAVFNRQTGSQSIDSTHASLTDTSQPINMIWSFNAQPPSTAPLGWSFWHGNNRGSFSVNLQSGDGTITTGISIVNKRIHGLGMALAWLILMPLGVFLSRYYRFKNNWMLAHISLQVSALLLVLSMLILIVVTVHNVPFSPSTLSTGSIFPKLHSIFGFTLFSLLFCQGLLGCLNRLGLEGRNEMVERARPVIKQIHNWSGRTLLLIGYIQVGFGIQILYPVSELANRGLVVWILYGIIKGISLIAFIAAETFYQRYLVNHSGYLAVSDDGKRRLENATIHSDHLRDHLGDNVDGDLEKLNGRKLFSWAEIDASIKEG